jgi:hypothetical protein
MALPEPKPHPIAMTDDKERIVALETNMAYVLSILAKREDYQASVLKSLTTIELKQDQALNYQKTCDAERSAHGNRIGVLENERDVEIGYRKILRAQAGAIAGIAAFLVSIATVYSLVKH